MSTVQIHVHWREPVDGESDSVFRGCDAPEASNIGLTFRQGRQCHYVNITATQLITITTEKEPA